jgi:DNA-binding MarR family transcriptional regulator
MDDRTLEQLPTALVEHVGYLLVVLGKRAQRAFTLALEPEGLRPPHFDLLASLDEGGARSQSALAKGLALEPAHLVSLLDELEELGLVARAPDPNDRRRYAISLTSRGATLTRRLNTVARRVEVELLADLSVDERNSLRVSLQRLARAGAHASHEAPPKKRPAAAKGSARKA